MSDFWAALQAVSGLGLSGLLIGLAVFFRMGAMLALLPVFGEQAVPMRIRLGLALGFSAVVGPAVAPALPPVADLAALMPLLASETATGLVLGLMLRLFILALQIAAAQIAQAGSLAQMVGGIAPEPQPAIGQLLTLAGLALAAKMGLATHVAALAIRSYDVFPAGQMPLVGDLADWGVARVGQAFSLGFALAAPFVIASVLYNLALGLVNRAMPQLQVSFIGAPALTFGLLALLALSLPIVLTVWQEALMAFLARPFAVP